MREWQVSIKFCNNWQLHVKKVQDQVVTYSWENEILKLISMDNFD